MAGRTVIVVQGGAGTLSTVRQDGVKLERSVMQLFVLSERNVRLGARVSRCVEVPCGVRMYFTQPQIFGTCIASEQQQEH